MSYRDEQWVLRDVSFSLERGQTVAIVGPTGSGKTTLINLLCRFYEFQRGDILLDGVSIRELSPRELRRQIALVLQDVFLFYGDVASNIRLGEERISDEAVREAARRAQASSFIERLPRGYESGVKERGATLSVGQKQLLAFARALAFDPAILILDEATASIDTETERLIQSALGELLRDRTSLVIAHRLSTIQRADKIIVLHHGAIAEQGTHAQLLARDGLYRRLYELQFGDN
jgi:ABC-type multidrug transport system fused ATPase/permease subunit